jgi:hypothetical protein
VQANAAVTDIDHANRLSGNRCRDAAGGQLLPRPAPLAATCQRVGNPRQEVLDFDWLDEEVKRSLLPSVSRQDGIVVTAHDQAHHVRVALFRPYKQIQPVVLPQPNIGDQEIGTERIDRGLGLGKAGRAAYGIRRPAQDANCRIKPSRIIIYYEDLSGHAASDKRRMRAKA